ncbi:hypothetical protein MTO96_010471 [Rhipicephalus appendiculatus]
MRKRRAREKWLTPPLEGRERGWQSIAQCRRGAALGIPELFAMFLCAFASAPLARRDCRHTIPGITFCVKHAVTHLCAGGCVCASLSGFVRLGNLEVLRGHVVAPDA